MEARHAAERVRYMWEIEGKFSTSSSMMHATHMEDENMGEDYFKQDPSPEPVLDGDTMVVEIHTLVYMI